MSDRLDELVALALDEALASDAATKLDTAAELDALLADPAMMARAMSLLRVEAALLAQRDLPAGLQRQVLDRVMGRVQGQRTSRVVRAVMGRVGRVGRVRRSRRRAWGTSTLLAAAGLILLLGGAMLLTVRTAPVDDVLVIDGSGTVDDAGTWRPLRAGARIDSSAQVRCETSLTLQWADGTRMHLDAGSRAALRADGEARLYLNRGEVEVTAAHHPERQAAVATAEAECLVVGTRFCVQATEGVTRLAVSEGRVSLRSRLDGSEQLVDAGGRFTVGTATGPDAAPRVIGFALADAATGTRLRALNDGDRLSVAEIRRQPITVLAITAPATVGYVRMQLLPPDGQVRPGPSWEEFPPYTLRGDKKEDFLPGPAQCTPWTPLPGRYRIEAQATFGSKGSTDLSPVATITLDIVAP